MSKFVKTSDKEMASKLRASGMICVGQENTGEFVFINDNTLPLKFEDSTKLIFSDTLMF